MWEIQVSHSAFWPRSFTRHTPRPHHASHLTWRHPRTQGVLALPQTASPPLRLWRPPPLQLSAMAASRAVMRPPPMRTAHVLSSLSRVRSSFCKGPWSAGAGSEPHAPPPSCFNSVGRWPLSRHPPLHRSGLPRCGGRQAQEAAPRIRWRIYLAATRAVPPKQIGEGSDEGYTPCDYAMQFVGIQSKFLRTFFSFLLLMWHYGGGSIILLCRDAV